MINVLPIVLVPLIVERKRIKQHPDVQKVTDATSKVASKHLQQSVTQRGDVKEYVGDKKQDFENKRELKSLLENMILPILRKKGEKLAKQNRKDADKMNKILQKISKSVIKKSKKPAKRMKYNVLKI